jgi:hypothetical protein
VATGAQTYLSAISIACASENQYVLKLSAIILLFSAGCQLNASCIVFITVSAFNKAKVHAAHHAKPHQFLFHSLSFFKLCSALNHINIVHHIASKLHIFDQACLCLGSLLILFGNICSIMFANLSQNLLLNDFGRHTILLSLQYASYIAGFL